MSIQNGVREFHTACGISDPKEPGLPGPYEHRRRRSRRALLQAEVDEYQIAEQRCDGDLADIARELADIVYVAYGTALAYGIDLDAVLTEVHRRT